MSAHYPNRAPTVFGEKHIKRVKFCTLIDFSYRLMGQINPRSVSDVVLRQDFIKLKPYKRNGTF